MDTAMECDARRTMRGGRVGERAGGWVLCREGRWSGRWQGRAGGRLGGGRGSEGERLGTPRVEARARASKGGRSAWKRGASSEERECPRRARVDHAEGVGGF